MKRLRGLVLAGVLALAALPGRGSDTPKLAGSEVEVPRRTRFVQPAYPAEAVARGLRGIVILDIVIGLDGKVTSAEVTRSVPPFDEAALAAVRQWEYDVTRIDGRPVSVRLSVPISFALRLPDVRRDPGIPELRQGITPGFPAEAKERRGRVVAQVTLDEAGAVAEAEVTDGESPFADAFLQALRTWQFAVKGAEERLTFRAEALFEQIKPGTATVDLALSELRHLPRTAVDAEAPAPAVTAPEPVPVPTPAVAPRPTPPPPPPVEVLRAPPAPTPPPAVPVSAVRDVVLAIGVPDLVRGRRPVPPPLARMAGSVGKVTLRFSVDAGGSTTVADADGPDLLVPAAREVVVSWLFRRTTAERMLLVAAFEYRADGAAAEVRLAE